MGYQAPQPTDNYTLVRIPRISTLDPSEILVRALRSRVEGKLYYFRGAVSLETTDYLITCDELDYDSDSGYAEARGNVHFNVFERGEEIEADRVEYWMREERGKYYNPRGSAKGKIDVRPGLLVSKSPFVFQGRWAERLGQKYVLYDGFITNCRLPRPWWKLHGPKFDIIPGDRAIAYNSIFRLKKIPLFYTPAFYKSLKEEPRKSGFLIPNIGNSSRRGKMVGVGYYWAINRSYDATYRSQWFTQRGFAHHVDFRGKPAQGVDFDTVFYGVNDRGFKHDDGSRIKQGGYLMTVSAKAESLPFGFRGQGEFNYLSSFVFRQAFTESFNEAVFAESHSRGYLAKHWSTYALNLVFERSQNFQSTEAGDSIVIRKLPMLDFSSRDRLLFRKGLPVWVSLESSAGLVRRSQPLFQTRQIVERLDFAPRVMTSFDWKGFRLLPSASLRETHYGASQLKGTVSGFTVSDDSVRRTTRDFTVDLIPPSLARVFHKPPQWLGDQVKHVIEPRVGFRYTGGVQDFSQYVRFDEIELVSNTRELEYSLTHRLLSKRGGAVEEVLSWQLWQKHYFDPTLGGAIQDGQRNVFLTQTDMTAYAFFDRPRKFSPVVSALRATPIPNLGVEWRSDYDPERHRMVNSSLLGQFRFDKYQITAGHNHARSDRALTPSSNQFIGMLGWGRQDLRGWSAGFQAVYDFRTSIMHFATTQISYNVDCCGLSVQYRRLSVGARNENQFRIAFAVANIGSFGTLRRNERVF